MDNVSIEPLDFEERVPKQVKKVSNSKTIKFAQKSYSNLMAKMAKVVAEKRANKSENIKEKYKETHREVSDAFDEYKNGNLEARHEFETAFAKLTEIGAKLIDIETKVRLRAEHKAGTNSKAIKIKLKNAKKLKEKVSVLKDAFEEYKESKRVDSIVREEKKDAYAENMDSAAERIFKSLDRNQVKRGENEVTRLEDYQRYSPLNPNVFNPNVPEIADEPARIVTEPEPEISPEEPVRTEPEISPEEPIVEPISDVPRINISDRLERLATPIMAAERIKQANKVETEVVTETANMDPKVTIEEPTVEPEVTAEEPIVETEVVTETANMDPKVTIEEPTVEPETTVEPVVEPGNIVPSDVEIPSFSPSIDDISINNNEFTKNINTEDIFSAVDKSNKNNNIEPLKMIDDIEKIIKKSDNIPEYSNFNKKNEMFNSESITDKSYIEPKVTNEESTIDDSNINNKEFTKNFDTKKGFNNKNEEAKTTPTLDESFAEVIANADMKTAEFIKKMDQKYPTTKQSGESPELVKEEPSLPSTETYLDDALAELNQIKLDSDNDAAKAIQEIENNYETQINEDVVVREPIVTPTENQPSKIDILSNQIKELERQRRELEELIVSSKQQAEEALTNPPTKAPETDYEALGQLLNEGYSPDQILEAGMSNEERLSFAYDMGKIEGSGGAKK